MINVLKNNQKIRTIILVILLLLIFLLLGLYGQWTFKNNELKNDTNITDKNKVDICDYDTGNDDYDIELKNFCNNLENKEKYKIYTDINQLENSKITYKNIERFNELLVSIPDENFSLYSYSNFYYLPSSSLSDILFGYIQYDGKECVSKDLLYEIANIIYGDFSKDNLYEKLSDTIDDEWETENFYCINYHKNDSNKNIVLNYTKDLIFQYDKELDGKIYSYTRAENDGSKYNVILTYRYNNGIYKLSIFNSFKDTNLEKLNANESIINLTQADKDKINKEFEKVPFYSVDDRQYYSAPVGENIFDSDLERADLALYYIFNEYVWENKIDKSYLKCDSEEICGVKMSYVHEVSCEFFGKDFDESKLDQKYKDGYAYADMGGGVLTVPLIKEKRYNNVTNEYSLIFNLYNENYLDINNPIEEIAERKMIVKYKIENGKKILTSWVYIK